MPNQYESSKRTLGELLSTTSPPIRVPEWQRTYSWTSTEVETFWLDLLSFSDRYPHENILAQEYFLGAIVLVHVPGNHLLLDGQQRLATATILLSVIRDFLQTEGREAPGVRTQQSYILHYDDATGEARLKLTLNMYDRDFFRREIQEERRSLREPPREEYASHRLIRRAREFFWRQFAEKREELADESAAFAWALRVRQVLTDHVSVVFVTSTDEDNAAAVFETLNDRGIGLSTPDLVRNLLLRRAPASGREEIVECWGDVLAVADDAKVEDFLRHYWLSQRGDLKTRRLYREIKRRIEEENLDSLDFSRDLQRSAALYRDIVRARDDNPEIARLLTGVAMLNAKALLPALLSSCDTGDDSQRQQLIQALTALFVRHNVIGRLENSRLETVVYNAAHQLRQHGDFAEVIRSLREAAPDDNRFLEEFRVVSISRQASASYILREIEHAVRDTQELEVAGADKVHIEHIYPRKPQGERWPNHSAVIHRLGNLTLLSRRLNQRVSNADFSAKREHYSASDIAITRDLAGYVAWNTDAINARQDSLAEHALPIWSFPE